MNILVVGAGGREQALAWKLAQSPRVGRIFVAPGNAGTRPPAENVAIGALDTPKLLEFARAKNIGLTVVGPDDALAGGIADAFEAAGLCVFGPRRAAAQLEASKSFAKDFMLRHAIPTAESRVFTDLDAALAWCDQSALPVVVKADGLALGKGVTVAASRDEARAAVLRCMQEKAFGEAGTRVLIEEFLQGVECSIHALVDGKSWMLCPDAKDHKRALEGDRGPNTGGMGVISPSGTVDSTMLRRIEVEILDRFLAGIRQENLDFRGLLFPGLMLTAQGPKVLEFNCRFGDPETQVLMRRLESDLPGLLEATARGCLHAVRAEWAPGAAACVSVVSGGYPGNYAKGLPVSGLGEAEKIPGVKIFHAGTALGPEGVVTAGGRVFSVTATGPDLDAARRSAYAAAATIRFDGAYFRRDIGGNPIDP